MWGRTDKGFLLFPVDQRISDLCSVSSTDDGDNTFTILDIDDNYVMFHLDNNKDGETFQLMELYGRVFSCRHWAWGEKP